MTLQRWLPSAPRRPRKADRSATLRLPRCLDRLPRHLVGHRQTEPLEHGRGEVGRQHEAVRACRVRPQLPPSARPAAPAASRLRRSALGPCTTNTRSGARRAASTSSIAFRPSAPAGSLTTSKPASRHAATARVPTSSRGRARPDRCDRPIGGHDRLPVRAAAAANVRDAAGRLADRLAERSGHDVGGRGVGALEDLRPALDLAAGAARDERDPARQVLVVQSRGTACPPRCPAASARRVGALDRGHEPECGHSGIPRCARSSSGPRSDGRGWA